MINVKHIIQTYKFYFFKNKMKYLALFFFFHIVHSRKSLSRIETFIKKKLLKKEMKRTGIIWK